MQPKFTRVEGVGIVMQSSSALQSSSYDEIRRLAGMVSGPYCCSPCLARFCRCLVVVAEVE